MRAAIDKRLPFADMNLLGFALLHLGGPDLALRALVSGYDLKFVQYDSRIFPFFDTKFVESLREQNFPLNDSYRIARQLASASSAPNDECYCLISWSIKSSIERGQIFKHSTVMHTGTFIKLD